MTAVNIAEAKARLSELVERAASGETVEIARRGRVVARLVSAEPVRPPIDWEALDRLRGSMPVSTLTVAEMRRRNLL
ncbi:prevent-host-death family protein [Sphingomonas jinjuensis]|uniref:Antitoxin n=1 Tax=Sphingomonas jinjuensis TaxID=535907 RepID=A0A840FA88_9SPHN|nr:type II toxin-antitoxin system prevent-host-death family antitoxin [Sphingomonas jinjuensis]MBB4152694.1 prevent-host-death family protein [Sphingomonas jinjuensis]